MHVTIRIAAALASGLLAFGEAAAQAACPVKIGGVLPLTGSMSPITKKTAQSAPLAIEHINEFDANGDVTGPALVWKVKDSQIVTDRVITIEEMQALFKRIEN